MGFSKILLLTLLGTQMAFAAPTSNPSAGLPKPPAPPTTPAPPSTDPQYEGTGRVDQVTRQAGGELYLLELSKAITLSRLEAKSKLGKVKIYSTTLVTDKNDRIPVRQLQGLSLDEAMQAVSSEMLTSTTGIAAIEILAEAMGGEASLEIKAFSPKEAPKLALGKRVPDFACKRSIDSLLKDKLDPVQMWVTRAEAAAPGSVQEKFAGNQLKEQVKDFVATIRMGGSYTTNAYLLTLMNFFVDQYNSVRAGGVSEPAYRDMLTATYDVLMIAIQNELPCRKYSSATLIKMSTDFNEKYLSMKQDAKARPLFATMMTKVRDMAPEQFRKELAPMNLSFRDADSEGSKYYKLYLAGKDEDFLRVTHRNMSAYAFVAAEQALTKEVKLMDIEQRYQLIVEFQAKYNSNTDFPQAVAARYLNILADPSVGLVWY
jgi:hypothetical protein